MSIHYISYWKTDSEGNKLGRILQPLCPKHREALLIEGYTMKIVQADLDDQCSICRQKFRQTS